VGAGTEVGVGDASETGSVAEAVGIVDAAAVASRGVHNAAASHGGYAQ